jgi:hypothetical protein
MLKLKLYLFLSKFIKCFKGMASKELIEKIKNEIFIRLVNYSDKDFEMGKVTMLDNATGYTIQISIEYRKNEFTLFLQYLSTVDYIETQYKIDLKNNDESILLSIINYYKYFKDMPRENILKSLKTLKLLNHKILINK